MDCQFMGSLLSAGSQLQPITALAWAPDRQRLAAATSERVVLIFGVQGDKLDKFKTKPAVANQLVSYSIRSLVWSADSTILAVAQSDGAIFGFRLGAVGSQEKKAICSRIVTGSPPTCLTWLPGLQDGLAFGCVDGRVRTPPELRGKVCSASLSNPKPDTLGKAAMTIALTARHDHLWTAHQDGWIFRCAVKGRAQLQRLVRHSCPAEALAASASALLAAGPDLRVVLYTHSGEQLHAFDFSGSRPQLQQFTIAAACPTGDAFLVGALDCLCSFSMEAAGAAAWRSGPDIHVEHMCCATAMAWHPDGKTIHVGTTTGALDVYQACRQRLAYGSSFQVAHHLDGSTVVSSTDTGEAHELPVPQGQSVYWQNVFRQRFIAAFTRDTLLLMDHVSGAASSFPWLHLGDERFCFDQPEVCIIHAKGQITVAAYGSNTALVSYPSPSLQPHTLSFRLASEQLPEAVSGSLSGCFAYVRDGSHVCVQEVDQQQETKYAHDVEIDFLELSHDAKHALFRDCNQALHLWKLAEAVPQLLLSCAAYAQWAPTTECDIIVAQIPSGSELSIWYGLEKIDQPHRLAAAGEVQQVVASEGGIQVEMLASDGSLRTCALDEGLIALEAALSCEKLPEALTLLEARPQLQSSCQHLWERAGKLAVKQTQLGVASVCYGAAGDPAKAAFLQETASLAEASGGKAHVEVAVRLAQLQGSFSKAEGILVQHERSADAVRMYRQLLRWDDAISCRVARTCGHMTAADVAQLRDRHLQWLLSTGQQARAGEVRLREGKLAEAASLFLQGGAPTRAAEVVKDHAEEQFEAMQLETIAHALGEAGLHQALGSFLEACHMPAQAVDAYQRGHAYQQAATLAHREAPDLTAAVEGSWAEWLSVQGRHIEAVQHYTAAGRPEAAVEAAAAARNWEAASALLVAMEPEEAAPHYGRLAEAAARQGCLEAAEGFCFGAGDGARSVAMWAAARAWDKAYAAAVRAELPPDALQDVVATEGAVLEEAGELAEAERMYLAFDDPDGALAMWHAHHRFDAAVDLVARVRPDQLAALHVQLGKQLAEEGQLQEAEAHFLAGHDWQLAVAAWKQAGQWSEALRVARDLGGPAAEDEVAFAWADGLGAARGHRKLAQLDLLDRAVAHGVNSGRFESARELAEAAGQVHLAAWAHHQHALSLQEQGSLQLAEAAFVACGQPGDAVEMYVQQGDYDSAARLAQQWQLPSLFDILAAQAQAAADIGDYETAEALWVRAQLPQQALDMLRAASRWAEAVAFAQRHLPDQVEDMELEARAAQPGVLSLSGQALLKQAHDALAESDAFSATHALLQITRQDSTDLDLLEQIWQRAVTVARDQGHLWAMEIAQEAARQLLDIGRHASAADMLASVDDTQEAVGICLEAGLFLQAKALARGSAGLMQLVEQQERHWLLAHGGADELAAAGHGAEAMEVYVREGRWRQAHALAAEQGRAHVAACAVRHATVEMEAGNAAAAASVLAGHAASPAAAHVELYTVIAQGVLSMGMAARGAEAAERNCHTFLSQVLAEAAAGDGDMATEDLQGVWEAMHLTALLRHCTREGLADLAAQQATARLRRLQHMPADKAFFEAGVACRAAGKSAMALAFLNRYLDLSEAIDDGDDSPEAGGSNDFRMFTGIPRLAQLPAAHFASEAAREEVREWTLSASLDASIPSDLPQVPCPQCRRPLYEASLSCQACRLQLPADPLTGYPLKSADGTEVHSAKEGQIAEVHLSWEGWTARLHAAAAAAST